MNIFLNNRWRLYTLFITLLILFLLALLFSSIYSVLPLRIDILPIFANLSLYIAVFCGAFYLSSKTAFFQFNNVIFHTVSVLLFLLLIGVLFGDAASWIGIKKIVTLFIVSFLGELFGGL